MARKEKKLVALLKEKGYRVVCAGIRDAVGLYEADLKKPLLLVVGGEKRGISAAQQTCGKFRRDIDEYCHDKQQCEYQKRRKYPVKVFSGRQPHQFGQVCTVVTY